ncbi:MAG: hypothetical protein ACPIOQ_05575, partial [Promethearchaeia archaeon]
MELDADVDSKSVMQGLSWRLLALARKSVGYRFVYGSRWRHAGSVASSASTNFGPPRDAMQVFTRAPSARVRRVAPRCFHLLSQTVSNAVPH